MKFPAFFTNSAARRTQIQTQHYLELAGKRIVLLDDDTRARKHARDEQGRLREHAGRLHRRDLERHARAHQVRDGSRAPHADLVVGGPRVLVDNRAVEGVDRAKLRADVAELLLVIVGLHARIGAQLVLHLLVRVEDFLPRKELGNVVRHFLPRLGRRGILDSSEWHLIFQHSFAVLS